MMKLFKDLFASFVEGFVAGVIGMGILAIVIGSLLGLVALVFKVVTLMDPWVMVVFVVVILYAAGRCVIWIEKSMDDEL